MQENREGSLQVERGPYLSSDQKDRLLRNFIDKYPGFADIGNYTISQLNDLHRWSFEQIAQWLEENGN